MTGCGAVRGVKSTLPGGTFANFSGERPEFRQRTYASPGPSEESPTVVSSPWGFTYMHGGLPPVGALLRRPALLVRRRVMTGLHSAGFSDLLPGHLAVFQYPGPDGQRPGVLASRSELSKQAMNHLLTQL